MKKKFSEIYSPVLFLLALAFLLLPIMACPSSEKQPPLGEKFGKGEQEPSPEYRLVHIDSMKLNYPFPNPGEGITFKASKGIPNQKDSVTIKIYRYDGANVADCYIPDLGFSLIHGELTMGDGFHPKSFKIEGPQDSRGNASSIYIDQKFRGITVYDKNSDIGPVILE